MVLAMRGDDAQQGIGEQRRGSSAAAGGVDCREIRAVESGSGDEGRGTRGMMKGGCGPEDNMRKRSMPDVLGQCGITDAA